MDIPIITESVLEQLDPKISENVKYLVFDSIQDVLFDLFKPHKNYLKQIEKGNSVLKPTSVSLGHLTKYLQTNLEKLLTYETTNSPNSKNLVKETVACFNQDFLKLDLYKEKVKVESACPLEIYKEKVKVESALETAPSLK
jgi:transcriptional regulator with XRE-family HTH domain